MQRGKFKAIRSPYLYLCNENSMYNLKHIYITSPGMPEMRSRTPLSHSRDRHPHEHTTNMSERHRRRNYRQKNKTVGWHSEPEMMMVHGGYMCAYDGGGFPTSDHDSMSATAESEARVSNKHENVLALHRSRRRDRAGCEPGGQGREDEPSRRDPQSGGSATALRVGALAQSGQQGSESV